jgi:PEGA domain
MRLHLAAIVLFAWPVAAAAQGPALPGGIAPLPPIGLPLPQIGLPLPQIGLPPATDPRGTGSVVQPFADGRFGRGNRQAHGSAIYLVPAYGWPYFYIPTAAALPQSGASVEPPKRHNTKPSTGRLRLDIASDTVLQLYVDGYYVGTSADVNRELRLEAGPHRLEIRAAGYEPLVVEVNIPAGRSITYRPALTALDVKPAPEPAAPAAGVPPAAAPEPMVVYVIPGCYVGNVPPRDAGLPASCDASRAITIQQQ